LMSKSPNISWIPTGQGITNLLNLKTAWIITYINYQHHSMFTSKPLLTQT
jgi:hypothetical protein